jgi:prepilin-type processing-associated H-X9-DG protein
MGTDGTNSVNGYNWRTNVLPFMELQTVFDQKHPTNSLAADVFKNKFETWNCPSSPMETNPTDVVSGWFTNPGHQAPCYIGIMGAHPDPLGRTTATFKSNYGGYYAGNGMLVPNEHQTFASCVDGSSNTIIASEQGNRVAGQDIRNRYYSPWGGCTFATKVSAGAPSDSWSMGVTSLLYAVNSKTTAEGCDNVYDASTLLNSAHPGGVQALLADGSVRFISDSVQFANMQRLCVRDDGIPLTEF